MTAYTLSFGQRARVVVEHTLPRRPARNVRRDGLET